MSNDIHNDDFDIIANKIIVDINTQIANYSKIEYTERLKYILSDLEKELGHEIILDGNKKGRPPIIRKKPKLILKNKCGESQVLNNISL